ncbi:hypothetical protein D3C72_2041960 [compost metagenome]
MAKPITLFVLMSTATRWKTSATRMRLAWRSACSSMLMESRKSSEISPRKVDRQVSTMTEAIIMTSSGLADRMSMRRKLFMAEI